MEMIDHIEINETKQVDEITPHIISMYGPSSFLYIPLTYFNSNHLTYSFSLVHTSLSRLYKDTKQPACFQIWVKLGNIREKIDILMSSIKHVFTLLKVNENDRSKTAEIKILTACLLQFVKFKYSEKMGSVPHNLILYSSLSINT